MIVLARALVLTALTIGLWMMAVRAKERARTADRCRVSYVYDGDTVAIECGAEEVTARVMGLDTPETKGPRCAEEAALGQRATKRLRALVQLGDVRLSEHGNDKYGRRLVRLLVDGRDVAETMVAEGLAVRYRGGTRPDWCARIAAEGGQ